VKLEEWRYIQAVEPATRGQLGAIMREFDRLGFGAYDRAERLAICARIIGLETLRSTKDLRLGEAGQLIRALMDCRSRADLPAAAPVGPAEPGGDDITSAREHLTFASLIWAIAAAWMRAWPSADAASIKPDRLADSHRDREEGAR